MQNICAYQTFSSVTLKDDSSNWHIRQILMYRSKLITIVQYTEVIIEICTRGNKTGITLGYATAENHGQWLGKLYNAAHPTTTAMS